MVINCNEIMVAVTGKLCASTHVCVCALCVRTCCVHVTPCQSATVRLNTSLTPQFIGSVARLVSIRRVESIYPPHHLCSVRGRPKSNVNTTGVEAMWRACTVCLRSWMYNKGPLNVSWLEIQYMYIRTIHLLPCNADTVHTVIKWTVFWWGKFKSWCKSHCQS